jgi:TonB family protein
MTQRRRDRVETFQKAKTFGRLASGGIAYLNANRQRKSLAWSVGLHVLLVFLIIIFTTIVVVERKSTTVVQVSASSQPIVQAQMITSQTLTQALTPPQPAIVKPQINPDQARKETQELREAKKRLEMAKIQQRALENKRVLAQKQKAIQAIKQAEAQAKKVVAAKKLADKKVLAKQKQADQKREAEIADRLKQLALSQLSNTVNDHTAAQASNAQKTKIQNEIDQYVDLIKRKVSGKWINPFQEQGSTAIVHLLLNPDGRIKSSNILQSSGNKQFDQQLLLAVQKSSPFPLPEQQAARSKMLDLELEF